MPAAMSSNRVGPVGSQPSSSRVRSFEAATSADALANPYHRTVTFTYDFFKWANLANTITDSHFVPRDRMGRTMAFIARQIDSVFDDLRVDAGTGFLRTWVIYCNLNHDRVDGLELLA